MMCAHQPAVRPQVNIAGIVCGGTPAKSRMTAAQNSTLVSMARSGRRSRSSASAACSKAAATSNRGTPRRCAVARSTRARGSSDRYTRCPKPINLSLRSRMALHHHAGIAGVLGVLEHRQHPRRCPAVQRAAHRADRAGQRGRHIGAGGGDHPRGEGGGVHPVLGGGHPVGIDGLDMPRVRFALPAGHETSGDGGAFVDRSAAAPQAGAYPARTARRRTAPSRRTGRAAPARYSSSMSSIGAYPQMGASMANPGLHVDPDIAGADGQREGFGRRQRVLEIAVDQ